MKYVFNFSTAEDDLKRYADRQALLKQLEGFDGLELMAFTDTLPPLIPPEKVIGVHLGYPIGWVDRFTGRTDAEKRTFGSREAADAYFGGSGPEAVVNFFRHELDRAARFGAEYAVFHVSDGTPEEAFTGQYHLTDEDVIHAAADLINEVLPAGSVGPTVLFENLWQPGLTMRREEMGLMLLDKVRNKNTGIMLDTGHLMHTELTLTTEEEGIAFIHRVLDGCPRLIPHIKGLHLQQSLTGAYMLSARDKGPKPEAPFSEKLAALFTHAFLADRHEPFTVPAVRSIVERVRPEYVNFEFISRSRAEHRRMLETQLRALGR